MRIELLDGTTRFPLQVMGERAGVCQGADISDKERNIIRARECILSGHGRVMEYVSVEFMVEGISARAARELYTHIGGSPSRLQSSTRYMDCSNFGYYVPEMSPELLLMYKAEMKSIADAYSALIKAGMSREDAANILPLGMETRIVMRTNLRMMENLMNQRLCSRAYKEMREFAALLSKSLSEYDEEWAEVATNIFRPKCMKQGFCMERKSCGKMPKKENGWISKIDGGKGNECS